MKTTNITELKVDACSPNGYKLKRDWSLVAGISALALVFLVFTFLSTIIPPTDDVVLYSQYANRVLGGEIPYRNFFIEYPPFSLPFFTLPAIFNLIILSRSVTNYTLFFQTQSFFLASGMLALVWGLLRTLYPRTQLSWRMFFITLATLLISLFIFRRFDVGATFLVALAFYLIYNLSLIHI